MVVGDAGSGKTRFAGTFPKSYFLDFDKGTGSVRKPSDQWAKVTIKDAPNGGIANPSRGIHKYGDGWKRFLDHMQMIQKEIIAGTWPWITIVWDSMTMLQQLCMNKVLSEAGRPDTQPQLQDYGGILNGMKTATSMFTAMPGFKIMTAHVERAQNPISMDIEKLPLGMGQYPALASMYYDEIYFIEAKELRKDGKKVDDIRALKTVHSNMIRSARSRRDIPDGTEAHFDLIAPYLDLPSAA